MSDEGYVLFNARIHTVDDALSVAEAIAVRGDRIAAVGSNRDVLQAHPMVRRLDATNLTIVPGFIDAHAHVMGIGEALQQVDLKGAQSVEEVVDRLRAAAASLPHDAWLLGSGWDQNAWSYPSFPTSDPLDDAFPDRPVWLRRVDGHAGWANSVAMRVAQIGQSTPEPRGGRMHRKASLAPSGIFVDAATSLVERAVPIPDEPWQRRALAAAIAEMHAAGITGVHDAGAGMETIERYMRAADDGELNLRINVMMDGRQRAFAHFCAHGPLLDYRNRLTVRSVKLLADGALGSRGAALLEGYEDEPLNFGILLSDPDEFLADVEEVVRCGFQVCTHAIGDRAVRLVLDTYERAIHPTARRDGRHRIEHAQVVHPADVRRPGELALIASVQPTHATSDMSWVEARLGAGRLDRTYAWRSLREGGARLAFGSDAPVERLNPLHGIYAATTRKNLAGDPKGGWMIAEAVARDEALRAYTSDAAYAGFQEERSGSLKAGMLADFVVLSEDPMRVPLDDVPGIEIVATFVGGERVFGGW